MNVDLEVKEPHTIQVEVPQLELVDPVGSAELVDEAEETLTHINSSLYPQRLPPSTRLR